MTSVDQFAAITRRIIAKDGARDFLPTALYPERQEVVALDALPEVDNRVELAIEWATARSHANEEFMLAILVGATEFLVVHRCDGTIKKHSFALSPAV